MAVVGVELETLVSELDALTIRRADHCANKDFKRYLYFY